MYGTFLLVMNGFCHRGTEQELCQLPALPETQTLVLGTLVTRDNHPVLDHAANTTFSLVARLSCHPPWIWHLHRAFLCHPYNEKPYLALLHATLQNPEGTPGILGCDFTTINGPSVFISAKSRLGQLLSWEVPSRRLEAFVSKQSQVQWPLEGRLTSLPFDEIRQTFKNDFWS